MFKLVKKLKQKFCKRNAISYMRLYKYKTCQSLDRNEKSAILKISGEDFLSQFSSNGKVKEGLSLAADFFQFLFAHANSTFLSSASRLGL